MVQACSLWRGVSARLCGEDVCCYESHRRGARLGGCHLGEHKLRAHGLELSNAENRSLLQVGWPIDDCVGGWIFEQGCYLDHDGVE